MLQYFKSIEHIAKQQLQSQKDSLQRKQDWIRDSSTVISSSSSSSSSSSFSSATNAQQPSFENNNNNSNSNGSSQGLSFWDSWIKPLITSSTVGGNTTGMPAKTVFDDEFGSSVSPIKVKKVPKHNSNAIEESFSQQSIQQHNSQKQQILPNTTKSINAGNDSPASPPLLPRNIKHYELEDVKPNSASLSKLKQ